MKTLDYHTQSALSAIVMKLKDAEQELMDLSEDCPECETLSGEVAAIINSIDDLDKPCMSDLDENGDINFGNQ